MQIVINKYSSFVVWLDSNFLISAIKDPDSNLLKLINFLSQNKEKYFVVEGDSIEIYLGNHKSDKVINLLKNLSSGCSFLSYEMIEQLQFQAIAQAVINKNDVVEFDFSKYIIRNPKKSRQYAENSGYVIYKKPSKFELNLIKNTKKYFFDELNKIKQCSGNKKTIEDQQKKELFAPLRIIRKICKKLQAFPEKDFSNDPDWHYLSEKMLWWKHSGGKDLEGLINFLVNYLSFIPFHYIRSILFGDLVAGTTKQKESDLLDIKHASALLPFCHIYFTDKSNRSRLISYKFHEKYGVEIYSKNTLKDFFTKHIV